jgi:hypothetical protein
MWSLVVTDTNEAYHRRSVETRTQPRGTSGRPGVLGHDRGTRGCGGPVRRAYGSSGVVDARVAEELAGDRAISGARDAGSDGKLGGKIGGRERRHRWGAPVAFAARAAREIGYQGHSPDRMWLATMGRGQKCLEPSSPPRSSALSRHLATSVAPRSSEKPRVPSVVRRSSVCARLDALRRRNGFTRTRCGAFRHEYVWLAESFR